MISEVRAGGFAAPASIEPFLPMPGRPRQLLWCAAELGHLLVRYQAIAQHDALVADVHRPIIFGEWSVGIEFFRPGGTHSAVIPENAQRTMSGTDGELVVGKCSRRSSLVADFFGTLPVGRAVLDTHRVADLHRFEDGRKLMTSDIAEHAGSEIPPATPGKRMIAWMIGAHRGGTDPEVPLDMVRAGRDFFGS